MKRSASTPIPDLLSEAVGPVLSRHWLTDRRQRLRSAKYRSAVRHPHASRDCRPIIPGRYHERLCARTANYHDSSSSTAASATRLQYQYVAAKEVNGAEISARSRRHSDCRTTISALCTSRCRYGSLYGAYATSSDPVGAELDGTHRLRRLCSDSNGNPPDFRPGEERGPRSRQQVGIVRPPSPGDGGAVPDHKDNAREAFNVTAMNRRNCPYPAGRSAMFPHHGRRRLSRPAASISA